MWDPVKAVIFDLDGVIIDSEPIYLENLHTYVCRFRPQVKVEQMYDTVGRSAADCWERIRELIGDSRTWQEIRQEYRDTVQRTLCLDYTATFRPQTAVLLPELKNHGLKLAVASSSGRELVCQVLEQTKIRQWFDVVVSGDQFQESKPNPEIYHYTASALGIPEKECLAVEDSTVGILAARNAGIPVAALIDERFSFEQWRADYQIQDLGNLLDLVLHRVSH